VPETPVPPAAVPGAIPPGYVLAGRYALARLIARGGMADVWEAKDTLLERQVAVKILHPHLAADAAFVARFRTEAVAAARLHHRSIVAIFDTCSDSGIEAIVMELARGHTLREELDRHGALDPLVVVNIGVDVADALQSAHAAGLIHRDVKPGNILLCDDQRVMVTDFGIAKVRDNSDRTQTGTMLGSVKYVSPEQVEGKPVDPRSDVYSLGVVLYEALTGHPPFVADTPAATALARLHATPPHPNQLRPEAPRALSDLIVKAMSRDPAGRFASAAEIRTALLGTRLIPAVPSMDKTQVGLRPGTVSPDDRRAGARPPHVSVSPPARTQPNGGATRSTGQPPTAPPPPKPARTGPRGALVAAILLLLAALVVALILVTRNDDPQRISTGDDAPTATNGATPDATATGSEPGSPGENPAGEPSGATPGTPVPLQPTRSFDPAGDGNENERDVRNVVDGDPKTVWYTEYYGDRRFGTGGGKQGVGVIVQAGNVTTFNRVQVTSPSQDWAASVYVADNAGGALADWGEPAAELSGIKGNATFNLGGAKGQYLLLWITELATGPSGPGAKPPYTLTVAIAELSATSA
jgi:eukaryotic-like serine/threonine-protein kinase